MKLDDSAFLNFGKPSTKIKSSNPLYPYLQLLEKYCEISFIQDTIFTLDYSGSTPVRGGSSVLNTLSSSTLSKHAKRFLGEKGLITLSTRHSPQGKCLELEFSFDSSHFYANKAKITALTQSIKSFSGVSILVPAAIILHIDYVVSTTSGASAFFKALNDQICSLFSIHDKMVLLKQIGSFWKLAAQKSVSVKKFSFAMKLRGEMRAAAICRIMDLTPVSPSEAATSIQLPTYTFRSTRHMTHCIDKELIYYFDVMQECTKASVPIFEKMKKEIAAITDRAFLQEKETYNQALLALKDELSLGEVNRELSDALYRAASDVYPDTIRPTFDEQMKAVRKVRDFILS